MARPFACEARARPAVGQDALLVVEDDGGRVRCALVRREGSSGVRVVDLVEAAQPRQADVARALRRMPRPRSGRAALVTIELAPAGAPDTSAPGTGLRASWETLLAGEALRSAGVYPLVGGPAADLDDGEPSTPVLGLQVERRLAAILELDGAGQGAVEVHTEGEHPLSPERALELVGPACDELWLCGSGTDLSALGYALASRGGTWVRIVGLRRGSGVAGVPSEGLATIRGAARRALGLAHPRWRVRTPARRGKTGSDPVT